MNTPVRFQPAIPPQINLFRGVPPAGNPAPFRRVSVAEINGHRIVEIDDRERRVKMDTTPAGAIEVEITDKQNPRNQPRKLDAQDLNDLKRKDAELGRLYDQHHGPAQRQPGAIGPAEFPFGIRPPLPARPPLRTTTPASQSLRQIR